MATIDLLTTNNSRTVVDVNADAVVFGIRPGQPYVALDELASPIDAALDGKLAKTLTQLGATGRAGEVTKLATLGVTKVPIVVAVGLGQTQPNQLPYEQQEAVRRAAGNAIRALKGTEHVALALSDNSVEFVKAVAEGSLLASYDFTKFKTELPPTYQASVRRISIVVSDNQKRTELHDQLAITAAVSALVTQARDWVNTPPNFLRPPAFADAIAQVAQKAGLMVEVLTEDALQKGGYGGLLAVGGGSTAPPRLVRIAYEAADAQRKVALVGKGITFDSGGLSIKPAPNMTEMKTDMAGAASVVATMLAVAQLKPRVNVVGYVALAENMPSGSAYRPGDVVKLYGGKTAEIYNTDAEGRIVLGDILARACEDKPDYLLETSTLTSGQIIALGKQVSGVMGTAEVCEMVKAAGERSGEPMWPMPLAEDVKASMESTVADLGQTNPTFDRAGSMLQGGHFLASCIVEGIRWAHIDIAGPSYNSSNPYGYIPKGATGVPTRTLIELVTEIAQN